MHKRLLNEASIGLSLSPDGPILIKAGEGASDPTVPDMSFVRTFRGGQSTVYLPGSSLKGVIRSHVERLARSIERTGKKPLACDPLKSPCGESIKDDADGPKRFQLSCRVCRMFGNNSVGSHVRFQDAYPADGSDAPRLEERNGVAIDRVFGSVAHGPFNYETVTGGAFSTAIHVRNFTLAQLGLLALALRDLEEGHVRFGFGKSRGLGRMNVRVRSLVLRYPTCDWDGTALRPLGGELLEPGKLFGVAALLSAEEAVRYEYPRPADDRTGLPAGFAYQADGFMGSLLTAPGTAQEGVEWRALGRACVENWRREILNA